MVDSSSQANVQALLAIFRQKDQPLMGMLQPGAKINGNKTVNKLSSNTIICDKNGNDTVSSVANNTEILNKITRSGIVSERKGSLPELSIVNALSRSVERISPNGSPIHSAQNTMKPLIKPKPNIAQKPVKSASSTMIKLPKNDPVSSGMEEKLTPEGTEQIKELKQHISELANEVTQALEKNASQESLTNLKLALNKLEKNSNSLSKDSFTLNDNAIIQSLSLSKFKFDDSSLILNNYICYSNKKFRRKELPPKEKLGPAPLKPLRPLTIRPFTVTNVCTYDPPPLPERSLKQFQRSNTTSVLSTKPSRSVPPPPKPASKPEASLPEEELYTDTAAPSEERTRPVSMIPEYTEEEELGSGRESFDLDELYADGEAETPLLPPYPPPVKPSKPPPAIPDTSPDEELYQDAIEPDQEEFYEVMPADLNQDEQETPLYTNRKDQDKLRRNEEKRRRREQKEQEKREKELAKLKKKFGLTGEEIPIDSGLVKADSHGGLFQLSVRKGEIVLILRMENNPSGKWLVKNERGKIGYVELTNIEVDADSIRSARPPSPPVPALLVATEKAQTWLAKFTACVRQVTGRC
ncbi:FYN-binding protein 1-like isoform X3 [Centruroides vittatus]